ncbi:MAG: sugar transferase [Mycolicibacterium sp.]|uniref:sugar transferase n=1 Tax=Mycolicibacterium sp. TaxID=2320850 RepID=UPI003D116857
MEMHPLGKAAEKGSQISAPAEEEAFAQRIRSAPWSTVITVSVDLLLAALAVVVGLSWASQSGAAVTPAWLCVLYPPAVVVVLSLGSAYRRRLNRSFLDEFAPVEAGAALAAMLLLAAAELIGASETDGTTVLKIWICAAILIPLGRLLRIAAQRHLRRRELVKSPTLIVGNGLIAHRIIARLLTMPELGLSPVGLIAEGTPWSGVDGISLTSEVPHLGAPANIEQIIMDTNAKCLVIAFSRESDESLTKVIRIAHLHGLRVWVVPRMFDVVGERAWIEHVGGLPLLSLPHTNPRGWQFALKHAGDRVCAALGLVAISPLFLTLALLVRLSSPGPIFFRQPRIGRDGKVFDCLKFRSMRPSTEADAEFELTAGSAPGGIEGADRRTAIGRVMRATSMDELPQLLNVVKGEMSLVGPRPERPEFVDLFEAQIRRYGERHRVKAGMTGWAQVHGLRGQTSIADRAEWDNYYIENWSLALDLKILALTIPAVLRRAT